MCATQYVQGRGEDDVIDHQSEALGLIICQSEVPSSDCDEHLSSHFRFGAWGSSLSAPAPSHYEWYPPGGIHPWPDFPSLFPHHHRRRTAIHPLSSTLLLLSLLLRLPPPTQTPPHGRLLQSLSPHPHTPIPSKRKRSWGRGWEVCLESSPPKPPSNLSPPSSSCPSSSTFLNLNLNLNLNLDPPVNIG